MCSKELMYFFEYCMTNLISYSHSWVVDDPNWTNQRRLNFSQGTILGMYKEKEPTLLSLVKRQYDNNELYRFLCKAVDRTNAMGKKMFSEGGINLENAHLQQYPSKEENLVEWYRGYNSYMIEQLSSENEDSIHSFLYIYYAFEEYRTYKDTQSEREQPNVHKIYNDETDYDFCKWNLIPVIDGHKTLKAYTPARIFDNQKN